MTLKINIDDYQEKIIKLSVEETEKLNKQGWVYDHEEDVLVLKDEDGCLIAFTNIETRTPDIYTIKLNCPKEESC